MWTRCVDSWATLHPPWSCHSRRRKACHWLLLASPQSWGKASLFSAHQQSRMQEKAEQFFARRVILCAQTCTKVTDSLERTLCFIFPLPLPCTNQRRTSKPGDLGRVWGNFLITSPPPEVRYRSKIILTDTCSWQRSFTTSWAETRKMLRLHMPGTCGVGLSWEPRHVWEFQESHSAAILSFFRLSLG